ncbi:thioesterase family protein [Aeromicrobium sp. CF4.19]|uniref:thioesterase family protein n=1 Tax=Aeromicrobium sp. CF4.19 TaxID=3373082 RepID=UPI003EE5318A
MSDSCTPDGELDRAVATTIGTDGLRHLELTADWNTPNGTANGGYVLAVLLRAALDHATTAAPAHPDPLTVSVSYFRPPVPGPASVQIRTLRTGRRLSVHEATLEQDDRPVSHAVITLHDWDAAGDVQHTPHAAPVLPAPEDCLDLATRIPHGTVPIIERYETRAATLPGWMQGEPSGVPEAAVWVRPRDGRRVDALAAAAIVDGYPPVTTEIGHIASATVQITVHLRRRPDTRWALLHVTTRHVVDGYHDEDVELWDEQGNLVAQSRQLAILQ